MDNREQFEAWVRSSPDLVGQLDYYFSSMDAKFVIWEVCAEQKDKEIAELKEHVARLKLDLGHTKQAWSEQYDKASELSRGEYICKKCGLRKDSEPMKADF